MKKLLILFIFSICLKAHAEVAVDRYIIEKPDGTVAIVSVSQGTGRPVENILEEQGLLGLPIKRAQDGDIPKDRKDREFWKLNAFGSKIVVDEDKKAIAEPKEEVIEPVVEPV